MAILRSLHTIAPWSQNFEPKIFLQFELPHSAVADTSKTVPGKSWLKFKNRDDQSTTLSILVEKLELPITANWS